MEGGEPEREAGDAGMMDWITSCYDFFSYSFYIVYLDSIVSVQRSGAR